MGELKKTDTLRLVDLFQDVDEAKKYDRYLELVNCPPPENWVKVHPYIKTHKYIPIDKVEYLLKKIYKKYQIEVKEYSQVLNSICISVRVHYLDVVSGDFKYHDGVGACELQTTQKTGALKLDMSNIARGAVPMALPIAKSLAVKDACDHLGDIFGANLNRKDYLTYKADENLKKMPSVDDFK